MRILTEIGLINYLTIKNVVIYLISINLFGFIIMFIDKKKAEYEKWRIPEKTLMIIALLGGSIGAIFGMYVFRHKTKKPKFFIGFPLILISEVIIITYFLMNK